ncbi:hypothetical protein ZHAS_00017820 [Anopheles sinensis]|uniref:DUF4201 domain-containing protein n=1 Tax=Anopheles sinensis TaxID=74873 RepID=A0A084WHV8_ANOSI|nr:hypothetical protein ZHAS_00017820 [Anopheles sinensis]
MAAIGPDRASCELAIASSEGRRDRSEGEHGEHAVNQLASSQSTAKTMADEAPVSSSYCTLPRPARLSSRSDEAERDGVLHQGQYYTLRRVGDRRPAQSSKDAVAMGQRMAKATGNPSSSEEQPESTQRLLYEQNMCTFENFCERRNSEQRLQQAVDSDRDTNIACETGGDGLGNFCTLRNGRRGWRSVTEGNSGKRTEGPHQSLAGDYCTLKKKKFQLNRKFVESFLEDPNAQVADYLSELDAYLDEMDGVDDDIGGESDASDIHSTPDENDEREKEQEELNSVVVDPAPVDPCSQSLQYYQPRPSAQGCGDERGSERRGFPEGDYQDDRIRYGDIKHFCTLPKQKRTQFLNAFKRGTSLRRTVVVDTESERQLGAKNVPEVAVDGGCSADVNRIANELEDLLLSIEESDKAVAALEALVDRRKRQHHPGTAPPFPFEQFRAFCLGWVRRCETATERVRHQTRTIVRANAEQRKLLDQKRQSLGSDTLRVNLEAFELEQRLGERDLVEAQGTDYELRRLGAEVKREMLHEKMALFEATSRNGRMRQNVERKTIDLDTLRSQIERVEREVVQLEQENAALRTRLGDFRAPNIVELVRKIKRLRKVEAKSKT